MFQDSGSSAISISGRQQRVEMTTTEKLFRVTPVGMAIAGVTPVAFLCCLIAMQALPRIVDPCVMRNFTGRAQRFDHTTSVNHLGSNY
jgi:hypothetical protein